MFRSLSLVLALAGAACLLPAPAAQGEKDHTLYVVTLRPPGVTAKDTRLAPSLVATAESGGILKGADAKGNPIISVPTKSADKLVKSPMVKAAAAVAADVKFQPVTRLRLSYTGELKPTPADLKELGVTLVEDYAKGEFMLVEPVGHQVSAALAQKLDKNKKIRYAAPSFRIQAIRHPQGAKKQAAALKAKANPPTNDTRWDDLWGMRNINAPTAWKAINQSSVLVAVIDTGINYDHEDLAGNVWTDANGKHGFNFVDDGQKNDDPMDKAGHGSHCAGTIGAVGNNGKGVVGVNWQVKVMAVRWLDANGSGHVENAIKAIDWAVEQKAKVLSNSWFWTEDDPDLKKAIKRSLDAGALFIVAASNFRDKDNNDGDNDQDDTFGRYPSSYGLANMVAVLAIDSDEKLATFSNSGKKTVHLGAPGVGILSTVLNNDYDFFDGTSMATPHVAGAAALLWGSPGNQNKTAAQIKQLLLSKARPLDTLKDRCTTGGTLDIAFLGDGGKPGGKGAAAPLRGGPRPTAVRDSSRWTVAPRQAWVALPRTGFGLALPGRPLQ